MYPRNPFRVVPAQAVYCHSSQIAPPGPWPPHLSAASCCVSWSSSSADRSTAPCSCARCWRCAAPARACEALRCSLMSAWSPRAAQAPRVRLGRAPLPPPPSTRLELRLQRLLLPDKLLHALLQRHILPLQPFRLDAQPSEGLGGELDCRAANSGRLLPPAVAAGCAHCCRFWGPQGVRGTRGGTRGSGSSTIAPGSRRLTGLALAWK